LPVRFNQPVPVVTRVDHQEREAQLLDGVEDLYPEQLLFQRAAEALRAVVARGFADERGARCDAEKGQLVPEAVAASRRKGVGYTRAGNVRFYRFEIVIEQEPDDEAYAAHNPTLPGSASCGKTFEEAKPNIREAIQQHLEALPAHGHRVLQNERPRYVEERTIGVP
jgi:predicted RNase H-like HicB family nuclease